jgi:hypothetical protein
VKSFYKPWIKALFELPHKKVWALIFITTSCIPKDDVVAPVPINECCFAGKCIPLREGYVTTLSYLSNSIVTAFQVDLTDGYDSDQIQMVFYSANPIELTPGKYEWKDFSLYESNSIIQGVMVDVTAKPVDLFGHGTFEYDYHTANQGSITIKKDGVNTTFTISLRADGKSLTGYFKGVLQKK